MACTTLDVSESSQEGFIITADKVSGESGYISVIHISKSDSPNGKVHLVKSGGFLELNSCILPDIQLDANGQADVELQLTETMSVFASAPRLIEVGCCSAFDPISCIASNELKFTVGTDWTGLVILGGAALIAAAVISRR